MSRSTGETDITLTIIRTADAKKLEVVLPLSTTLGELKEDLGGADLFGPLPEDHQRLFFLGRELKSNHRSLQKLGLDRFPKNRVLHLHAKQQGAASTTTTSSTSATSKRQRKTNTRPRSTRSSTQQQQQQQQQKVTVTQTSAGNAVLEIHDDSDVEIVIDESPRDKRRRIS
ncbi:unnamed protein product [Cylindrotheca closterium]|uniref:Ubiquitin-like domain-containing protein n=1 Tax=Cylindrotheca closterium TaxID=2856 RepID=A0AAD2CGD6_9STRA|nr:unnamed protein product [Cylindrotheca closterium]